MTKFNIQKHKLKFFKISEWLSFLIENEFFIVREKFYFLIKKYKKKLIKTIFFYLKRIIKTFKIFIYLHSNLMSKYKYKYKYMTLANKANLFVRRLVDTMWIALFTWTQLTAPATQSFIQSSLVWHERNFLQ